MANTLEKSIRGAAEKLATMLENNSTLTIRTFVSEVGAGGTAAEQRTLVAETVIALDGDYTTVIPVNKTESGALERDDDLLNVHQQNVQAAIQHRSGTLNALLNVIK